MLRKCIITIGCVLSAIALPVFADQCPDGSELIVTGFGPGIHVSVPTGWKESSFSLYKNYYINNPDEKVYKTPSFLSVTSNAIISTSVAVTSCNYFLGNRVGTMISIESVVPIILNVDQVVKKNPQWRLGKNIRDKPYLICGGLFSLYSANDCSW